MTSSNGVGARASKAFAEAVRNEREGKRISQEDASAAAGVSLTH